MPPLLPDALGYFAQEYRFIAVTWLPGGEELLIWDGPTAQWADLRGWSEYAGHPLGAALLRPYPLRPADETPPEYALVADLWEGTLSVGRTRDVGELVSSQPNLLDAAAVIVGDNRSAEDVAEWVATHIVAARAALAGHAADPTRAARQAVRLWMDERLEMAQSLLEPDTPPPGPDGLDLG
jgi:hypothetical protein